MIMNLSHLSNSAGNNLMTRSILRPQFSALLMLALLLLLSISFASAQEGTPDEPETEIIATSEPFEAVFGSGPFNLFSPTQGLSDLSSYRATLVVSFEGMNAGQDIQWSRTYTMLVTKMPPARQLTIEYSDDSATPTTIAEINNTVYERRDGSVCAAKAGEVNGTLAQSWEPAGFLDSVIGADEAGSEIVNEVASNHYTFDESAQGRAGIEATGELWLASEGGYLVRYTLMTTAGADYFGEGIEGVLSWDYQLSDVNQPVVIEIPDDCPPPLLDIVVMPDAADVVRMPGSMSYTTPSTVQEVAAFYEEQARALGGQVANPPLISESSTPFIGTSATALFGFVLDEQSIMLIASSDGEETNVQIQSLSDPADLSFTAEVPNIVIAPEDTLGHCAAGGTPLLDDASEVISLSGGLNYITSMSAEDAATFYQEQFAAMGAEVSPSMTISGITSFDVTQGFHQISVTLLAEGANTRVSLTSTTGSPVTPATTCAGSESGECEAGGIPVLAGATNMQNVMGMLSYNTTTSVADTVAFYEEQIAAQGGRVSHSMPVSDMMAVMDVQLGGQSIMLMIGASGDATNVNITSLTGTLPSATICAGSVPAPAPTEPPPSNEAQNTPVTECAAGTDMLPIPADAASIQGGSGLLSYTTQMSMTDIIAFYEEQVVALGGQVSSTMPASDMMASFDVTQGDQAVSVIIVSGGGANNVTFTSVNPLNPLSYCTVSASVITEESPDQVSEDCIASAEDIPLLPDAANVLNVGGTVTFVTKMSVADASAFYEEQLSPLGEITSPMPASNMMAMLNVAIGDYTISVSITALDESTRTVTVGFIATNPFAGPPDCSAVVPQTEIPPDTATVACSVRSSTNANQRSGPGTNFDRAGTLAGGVSAAVDGQATGADGFVWWRLGEGVWVRSDVVDEAGDCESVPIVQP